MSLITRCGFLSRVLVPTKRGVLKATINRGRTDANRTRIIRGRIFSDGAQFVSQDRCKI